MLPRRPQDAVVARLQVEHSTSELKKSDGLSDASAQVVESCTCVKPRRAKPRFLLTKASI